MRRTMKRTMTMALLVVLFASGLGIVGNHVFAYRTSSSDYDVKLHSATGNGTTDDAAAIAAAITASQPAGGLLYFPAGTYRLASDVTFPTNTTLVFDQGAVLVPDSGVNVTINGGIDAGQYQIFTSAAGKGNIKGRMGGTEIYPQWWGADGTDSGDDTAALQKAMNSLTSGGTLYIPGGTYHVSAGLDLTGLNRLNIVGAGVDVTVIKSTSATADVFFSTKPHAQRWQSFKSFTIDSSVAKTAGAHFNLLGNQYRTVIEDVKLQNWHKGIVFASYEMSWITRVQITNPSAGAEAAIQVGIQADAAQGANLFISESFLRGTDGEDGVSWYSTAIAKYGIAIYDADAVMLSNSDIGGFVKNDLLIDPLTRSSNHYIDNVWFDATRDDSPVLIQGTGIKTEITFANNWISSAGHMDSGNATASNLRITGTGAYRAVIFTGNRIYNSSGIGVLIDAANGFPGLFTGNFIHNSGTSNTVGHNYGMKIDTGLNTPSVSVLDSAFDGNAGDDIYITGTARKYTIQNVTLSGTITNLGIPKRISGVVSDVSKTVASANTLNLPPFGEFYNITGTTNIGGITATWAGHTITLKFNSSLTVVDDAQNLRLAGNFSASANSTLTLICDGAEWFEVSRSVN